MTAKTPTKADAESEIEKEKKRAKKALRRELAMDAAEKVKASPLAQKKKAARKKRMKKLIMYGIILLLGYGVWLLFKPFKKGMNYGICKVFIELQVPYPYTLYYSEAIDFADYIRVWFSYLDSFGDYTLTKAECYFGPHEKYGFGLTRATIGKREIDPEVVEKFNSSIPAIVTNPPDLTYPTPLPNDPKDLQFDFDAFRKKILD